jgi:PQQ-dependent dehydrogenase (methanol/ethanol family)
MYGRRRLAIATLVVAAAAAVVFTGAASSKSSSRPAIKAAPAFTAAQLAAAPSTNWISTHGNLAGQDFSSLNQINLSNVKSLKTAWTTHLAALCPASNTRCSGENDPIEYNGIMYINDGAGAVEALNATTGEHLWKFLPTYDTGFTKTGGSLRGIAMGQGLIFSPQMDGRINGINMKTGKLVWSTSLGDWRQAYNDDAAPVYYDGLVFEGMSGGDSANSDYIDALDAATGRLVWHFNVIPGPGQPGYKTWGDKNNYHAGGGAVWDAVSIDPKLGLVYAGTGNPIPWNFTKAGKQLYTESIVALHVHTGKVAWAYQTVHHDIWDDDNMNSPILFNAKYRPYKILSAGTLEHGNPEGVKFKYTGPAVMQPAVSLATKMGYLFILNRKTGVPLVPTPEMKADLTGAQGLNLWPTQPTPIGGGFTNYCFTNYAQWPQPAPDGKPYRFGCTFTPYNDQQFLVTPHDSIDWPPMAVDPTKAVEYVCASNNRGGALEALPEAQVKANIGVALSGEGDIQETAPPSDRGHPVYSDDGEVAAVNLITNKMIWRTYLKKGSGPCYSGVLATAGGLVFVGQNDGSLEAFNAATGASVWQSAPQPSGANSLAMTYSVAGKQYVSIYTGGVGHESTPRGDLVQTFALQ